MLRALNLRLAEAADDNVLLVDCDRIASDFGKRRWFDDRYWHLAKQAVALDALPDLASAHRRRPGRRRGARLEGGRRRFGQHSLGRGDCRGRPGGLSARRRASRRGIRGVPGISARVALARHPARGRVEERRPGRAGAVRAASGHASVPVGRRRVHRQLAGQGDEREAGLRPTSTSDSIPWCSWRTIRPSAT